MVVRSFTYPGFEGEVGAQPAGAFEPLVKTPLMPAPGAAPAVEPEPPMPMFSGEEIEVAKNLAKDEGYREGYEKAKREYEEKLQSAEAQERAKEAEMLQKLDAQVAALNAKAAESKQKFSDKLGQISLAIAKKVCGDVSDQVMEVEISKILAESISKLDAEERIKVYASPKNAQYLNTKFTGMAVNVDPTMELGDFRIEWKNGFAKRDVKKIWDSISEICGRHSELEENETEEQQLGN